MCTRAISRHHNMYWLSTSVSSKVSIQYMLVSVSICHTMPVYARICNIMPVYASISKFQKQWYTWVSNQEPLAYNQASKQAAVTVRPLYYENTWYRNMIVQDISSIPQNTVSSTVPPPACWCRMPAASSFGHFIGEVPTWLCSTTVLKYQTGCANDTMCWIDLHLYIQVTVYHSWNEIYLHVRPHITYVQGPYILDQCHRIPACCYSPLMLPRAMPTWSHQNSIGTSPTCHLPASQTCCSSSAFSILWQRPRAPPPPPPLARAHTHTHERSSAPIPSLHHCVSVCPPRQPGPALACAQCLLVSPCLHYVVAEHASDQRSSMDTV